MTIVRSILGLMVVMVGGLVGGCAAEPFERPPLPVLVNPNPSAMRAEFAGRLAERFISDDTVIIQAPFQDDMAVLGVLQVDRAAGTFELMGMNHMGLKLFHLGADAGDAAIRYALPPLMEQKDVLLSMAADTRRMYLDLAPAEGATVKIRETYVRFSQETPEGTLVYEFGGAPVVLLEKRMEGFLGTIWRVRYYDYAEAGSAVYPRGVVMDNDRFGYRIIVKNRTWQTK
jgi:hypothetical protein